MIHMAMLAAGPEYEIALLCPSRNGYYFLPGQLLTQRFGLLVIIELPRWPIELKD